ncbi:SapC family protein [Sphingomonas suaedae]|uniref:SapC family protein n=1 Tax=Sphingomonas suaedae TaxID=2599297 RepID=A0A518RAW1_9SPHN|nr:SapC family protein [Sphingomonas suaedae]QDX24602.1 SapC family protein [Sphingomonas suaedae]
MGTLELLNPVAHAGLRLDVSHRFNTHFVQIVASEFIPTMQDYPILFTKHPQTGSFYAGALLALEPGEESIRNDGVEPYRPADLIRQGFFLVDGQLAIDPDAPVFTPAGTPLFDANGEPGDALRRVQRATHILHHGLPETDAIIARFLALRLIEPIDIALNFDDGSRLRLDGLYSISLDVLHALSDADALDLFHRGDLQLAYAQTASVQHIRRMAQRRNDRLFVASA